MSACMAYLFAFHFLEAVGCPFTELFGNWFYVLMLYSAVGGLFLFSRNVQLTAGIGLIGTFGLIAWLQTQQPLSGFFSGAEGIMVGVLVVVLLISSVFYRVYKGKYGQ